MRSFARFGAGISIEGALKVKQSEIKYEDATSTLEFKVGTGTRAMSVNELGGTLHGTWAADDTISTSDRRLKKSIVPLYRAIAGSPSSPSFVEKPVKSTDQRDSVVSWVLRELRPVSFSFKHGPEAKHSRYGFVAQELQQVLPALVRGTSDEHLSVVYQDLIALLALAAQTLQAKLETQATELQAQQSRIETQQSRIEAQQAKIEAQDTAIAELVRLWSALDKKLEQRTSGFTYSDMKHV